MSVLGFTTILLLLAGCAGNQPRQIDISTTPIDRPVLVLPEADPLRMRNIEWVVITQDNFDDIINEMQETGNHVVFFALTDQGYENLSLNLNDLRAYIQQQQRIIVAYENYYDR